MSDKPDIIYGAGHLTERQWKNFAFDEISRFSLDAQRLSISSTSLGSYTIGRKVAKPSQLHQILTANDIEQLHDVFKSREGKLSPEDLRRALEGYKVYFTDEDFERLFLKINTDRDWMCSWDEFVTYLILGFEDDEGDQDKEELDPPIKELPKIKRTRLRHQLVRVNYYPTVLDDRSMNMAQGSYVVAATDGTVNYYTLDWELQRVGSSKSRE